MAEYKRIAIYWLPEGDLLRWGESWLGWDMARGVRIPRMQVAGLPHALADMTGTATGYGLHATIKPPFRLSNGHSVSDVEAALAAFCTAEAPCLAQGLALTNLDGFLGLTLLGDTSPVDAMAARAVAAFDPFRAAALPEEIARRRATGLTLRQDGNLLRWGYPYVFEDFRFHITLTDRLTPDALAKTTAIIEPMLERVLPRPLVIGGLALVGQTGDGFRLIAHHAFTG